LIVEFGDGDSNVFKFQPAFRREDDHNRIPPITAKATKMAINSSKPRAVSSDDLGLEGGRFVIVFPLK
jgi:hypothetical protein